MPNTQLVHVAELLKDPGHKHYPAKLFFNIYKISVQTEGPGFEWHPDFSIYINRFPDDRNSSLSIVKAFEDDKFNVTQICFMFSPFSRFLFQKSPFPGLLKEGIVR